jgi:prepilin-type N-terminal cleavage/methylation domain-containing protein
MENRQARRNSDSGLTLIELMVAMIILTFGVVAALSILVEAHKSNNFAKAKTMAVNAAEERLENVFDAGPAFVESFDDTEFFVGDLVGNGTNGEPGLITVDGNQPHLVTVTVTWLGQGARAGGTVQIMARRDEAPR